MHQLRRAQPRPAASALSDVGARIAYRPRQVRWAEQHTRGTRSLQVLRVLQDEVVSGRWPEGSRIPVEAELSEWLSVSRSTVREAVSTLVHLGMLEPRPSQGTFVRACTALPVALSEFTVGYQVEEIRPLLRSLEVEAALAAARNRSEPELDELRLLAPRGMDGDRVAVRAFHDLVFRLAGNGLLADLRQGIEGRIRADVAPGVVCATAHGALAEAIAANDADAVRAAVCAHVDLRLPSLELSPNRRPRPGATGSR